MSYVNMRWRQEVTCFLAALSLEVFGRNSYNFVALGGRFQTGHNSESVMRVPRKIKEDVRFRLAKLQGIAADSINSILRDNWDLFGSILA